MSTPQRIRARVLTVDRNTADVLRVEVKKILVFNHDLFEDLLDLSPSEQHAVAMRFRDAIDLITTLGWDPDTTLAESTTFEVRLTYDLFDQLLHRRFDLAGTNRDRLDDAGETIDPDLLAEITTDRLAVRTITGLVARYAKATAT